MNRLTTVCIAIFSSISLMACSEEKVPENIFQASISDKERTSIDRKQDKVRHPEAILKLSGVNKGMSVIDISAGNGYYTELFSRVVGDNGLVYLHNTLAKNKKIKADIEARVGDSRLKNVNVIASDIKSLHIPTNVDIVFISKIFHDFYVPKNKIAQESLVNGFFSELKKKLNPKGKVLLIDHSAPLDTGITLTSKLHRIDEKFVVDAFEKHGFSLIGQSDVLRNRDDSRKLDIWNRKVFKKTDKFIYLFARN